MHTREGKSGKNGSYCACMCVVWYFTIIFIDSNFHIDFYRIKLLMYKPFHEIPIDIGSLYEEIIANCDQIKGSYNEWHVGHIL